MGNLALIQTWATMSTEEHSKLWYGRKEIESIRNEIRTKCAKVKEQRIRQNKNDICMRGLEHRIDIKRQVRRRKAIKAVLNAQRQFRFNNSSVKEYLISDISSKFSLAAKSEAILAAKDDAKNALLN